jgi:ribosome maturation factor RimP
MTGRVQELVAPLLDAQGLELVDVEVKAGTLRIAVDQPGGVDLDAIAQASHIISEALDREDPLPGRYSLEVSSPGVERPLRTPAHFQRFVGTTVSVRTTATAAPEGERRVQGHLDGADEEGITVEGRRIAYGDIDRAHTVFEWGPAAKPGQGGKKKPKPEKKAAS